MIRVVLPLHLSNLSGASHEIMLDVEGHASVSTVLEALEARYPMLRGTIRDQVTFQRRPFIRFFACGEDLSLDPPTNPLPKEVTSGEEPLRVVGAMAGG